LGRHVDHCAALLLLLLPLLLLLLPLLLWQVMCFPGSYLSALKEGAAGRRQLKPLHDLLDIDITLDAFESWPYEFPQIVKWALVASAQETSSLLIGKGRRDAALWVEAMQLAPIVREKQQREQQQQLHSPHERQAGFGAAAA
jgi:hypothetical protein